MKNFITIIILFFSIQAFSQSDWKKFKSQSSAIKTWIIFHPFKAKKAQFISKKATEISDSISNTNLLDKDKVGGQIDAFRHAYWMATLRVEIGKCASKSLGRAYERSNKKTYKKNLKAQKKSGYDFASKRMDLFNNKFGLQLTRKKSEVNKNKLIEKIISSIKKGELKVLKKDQDGKYLNCEGTIISNIQLQNWRNKKCIISSNI